MLGFGKSVPVMWHSFELRPFDFFDRNPALDLPKR
jgi:Cu2+-containing amine oxidase